MAASNFNLPEWYAAHRGEVEVLCDPSALFALGFLDHLGETPRGEFQQDLGVEAAQLDRTIEKLYSAGFISTHGTTLAITPQGKQFLTEIGLTGPLPPPSGTEPAPEPPHPPTQLPERPPAKPPASPAPRTPFWLWGLIGILILGILLVFGVLIRNRETQQPTRVAVQTATLRAAEHTPTRREPTVSTDTPVVQPELDIAFSIEPGVVAPGDCAILSWKVSGAREVYLDAQLVEEQARQRVCPKGSTSYTLTAISLTGEKHTRMVAVVVAQPRPGYVWSIVGKNPPFDNLRLQSALASALDTPAISKMVLQSAGRLRSADPRLDEQSYDVARAQELMNQSNYDRQPVRIVPNPDSASRELANVIAKYLAEAGFNVQLLSTLDSRTTIFVGPE